MTTTTTDGLPRLVSQEQLQEALGGPGAISTRTIQRMAKAGKIPGAVKIGRIYLFQRIPLMAWLDGGAQGVVVPLRRQA